jgi:hypothetical protein
VGARLAICLRLPDSEPLEVLTEVRWKRPYRADSDAGPGLGVKFIDLAPTARARIHEFIARVREPLSHDDDAT